jgi:uncharacterized membrane protein
MSKNRLENFTDAMFAILMTILVLDLHAPALPAQASFDSYWNAFGPIWPKFLSFALSFIVLAVYWINHHHFFQYVEKVTTKMLWLNVLLLFIVAFIPFSASLLGDHITDQFPIIFYATNTLLGGMAFYLLRDYVYQSKLFRCDADEAARTFGPQRSLPGIITSALAVIAAFIDTPTALVFLIIYPALYVLPENFFIAKK